MKKVAKDRKRRERALKRWKKKSWIAERLKNRKIYIDLQMLNEHAKPK